jgi:hypothetical protein
MPCQPVWILESNGILGRIGVSDASLTAIGLELSGITATQHHSLNELAELYSLVKRLAVL